MRIRTGSLTALILAGLTSTAFAQANTIIGPDGTFTNSTGPVSVTQTANSNTVGVVQVGGNPTATISQTGFFNKAAVAQVGNVNTATVFQTGTYNRACIAQFGATNNAATTQNGAFNSSIVFQTQGAAPNSLLPYVQNCLNGPESATPDPDLGQLAAVRFTNTLFTQLDNDRWQTCSEAPPPMVVKGVAPQPQERCPKWSTFWLGSYGNGDWNDRIGASGLSYKLYSVTGGAEYRFSPNFLVGLAGSFTRTDSDLTRGLGGINLDTTQIGAFASYYNSNFFLDGVVTWGFHDFRIVRTGFDTSVTAQPKGDSFTAGARAGYLSDMGWGKLGPIAGVTYARTKVDAYTETGDPLLTQSVHEQSVDALIGSVGGQLRIPYMMGQIKIDPYVNLTAERDFNGGGLRLVGSTFTQNPTVAVLTPVFASERTFGRVAGGVNFYVTPQMSALISAESTFARSGHDDFSVTGGFKASF